MINERIAEVPSLHAMELHNVLTQWTENLSLEMTSVVVTELWDGFEDYRLMAQQEDYMQLFDALFRILSTHDVTDVAQEVSSETEDVEVNVNYIKYSTILLHDVVSDVIITKQFSLDKQKFNNLVRKYCVAVSRSWVEPDDVILQTLADNILSRKHGLVSLNSAMKLVQCLHRRSLPHDQLVIHCIRQAVEELHDDLSILLSTVNLSEFASFVHLYTHLPVHELQRIREQVGRQHFEVLTPLVFKHFRHFLLTEDCNKALQGMRILTRLSENTVYFNA